MKMISLTRHVYAGRRLNTGDEFEVRGQGDARLLNALGRAEVKPEVAAILKPPLKLERKVVEHSFHVEQGAPDGAGDSATVWPKPKRTYRRRDMKADE